MLGRALSAPRSPPAPASPTDRPLSSMRGERGSKKKETRRRGRKEGAQKLLRFVTAARHRLQCAFGRGSSKREREKRPFPPLLLGLLSFFASSLFFFENFVPSPLSTRRSSRRPPTSWTPSPRGPPPSSSPSTSTWASSWPSSPSSSLCCSRPRTASRPRGTSTRRRASSAPRPSTTARSRRCRSSWEPPRRSFRASSG